MNSFERLMKELNDYSLHLHETREFEREVPVDDADQDFIRRFNEGEL